ncbi:MAG: serine/threonine-protein kinase [Nannocystaceae bacterium]
MVDARDAPSDAPNDGEAAGLCAPLDAASGRYVAERELGRGASGVAYLCRRESDGARFVLKELRLAMIEEWKSLELFEREVATLRSLDHPGIPGYVDAVLDRDNGRFALVQEHVEGRTLADLIDAGESLSIEAFTAYLRGALEVLVYLHGRVPPVIHRDLQPRNLMVAGDRLYVIDFGAVCLASTESTTVTVVGSFGYMAPEQQRGRATPASDLFALGMTFVALAARRDPAQLPADPQSGQVDPRGLLAIPTPLQELLLAMIEPGLGKRLGRASEALARLDAATRPAPLAAREPAAARSSGRAPGRLGRALRVGAAGLAIVMSVALVGGYIASRIPAAGEVRALGGWFSGHGRTLAAIQTTLFGGAVLVHPTWISALAFSPDGERLASSARDGVILWRVADGSILARDDGFDDARALTYTLAGDALVGVDWQGDVSVRDPQTAALLRTYSGAAATREAFGGGHLRAFDLWAGDPGTIRVAGYWEPPYVEPIADAASERPPTRLLVLDPIASAVVWSTPVDWTNISDAALRYDAQGRGQIVASGARVDPPNAGAAPHTTTYPLVVFDLDARRPRLAAETPSEARAVAFARGGEEALSLGYDGLFRWDLAAGERAGTLGIHRSDYRSELAVHDATSRLATSYDRGASIVDLDSGDSLGHRRGHRRSVVSLAFSPAGDLLATGGSDQRITLWSVP